MGAQNSTQRRVSEGVGFRRSRADFGNGPNPDSDAAQPQDGEENGHGGRSSSRRRRAVESLVSKVTKKTHSGGTRANESTSGRSTPGMAVSSPNASGHEGGVRSRHDHADIGEDVAGSEREGGGTDSEAPTGQAEVSHFRR